ncbi:MAG: BMP family ABC transporter substrate-binding protein [Actinobacteria bacterium]|nr:MAG: BMP family ABC transporter substrate-binding protein [Actinomycetota bacterium]
MKSKRLLLLAIAVVAAGAALAAGLGSSSSNAAPRATARVAVVTDIGGLNDKGFNHLAYVGLQRAQSKLGVDGRVFITNTAEDRLPNLRSAAQQGYGLVIGVGFLMFDPLDKLAPAVPNTKFAGVDVPYALLASKPANVRGLVFKEQEAGYLVGYIAGLEIKRHPYKGKQVVSGVGANKVPAIIHFLTGYAAGAKKANPKVTVLINYANDPTFADQAKCKVTTQNQISRGSGVVFEAAGQCGLGGLTAAKQSGVWGIGVDADQSFLGPHILTSATKKVDVAVYQTIQAYAQNPDGFTGGSDQVFSVKNGAVGYGKLSPKLSKADRAYILARVSNIAKQIASGKIVPPSGT